MAVVWDANEHQFRAKMPGQVIVDYGFTATNPIIVGPDDGVITLNPSTGVGVQQIVLPFATGSGRRIQVVMNGDYGGVNEMCQVIPQNGDSINQVGSINLFRPGVIHEFTDVALHKWNSTPSFGYRNAPTFTPGAGMGTGGGLAAIVTAGTQSQDSMGSLSLTTGNAGVGAGVLCTAVFQQPWGTFSQAVPFMFLSPMNSASRALLAYPTLVTRSGFQINCDGVPAINTTYLFNWLALLI